MRGCTSKPQKRDTSENIKTYRCKYCKSNNVIKRGLRYTKNGKVQRFLCNKCRKSFVLDEGFFKLQKSEDLVTTCLDLYMNGLSLRKLETT